MFLLPSLLGVFLFMAPIEYQDTLTIPIAVLAKSVQALFEGMLTAVVTFVISLTAVASIFTKLLKPRAITENSFLNGLLNPSLVWFVVQQMGAVFVVMTFFGIGPKMIHDGATGAGLQGLCHIVVAVKAFAPQRHKGVAGLNHSGVGANARAARLAGDIPGAMRLGSHNGNQVGQCGRFHALPRLCKISRATSLSEKSRR